MARDKLDAWPKRDAGLISARHADAPRAIEVGLASARLGNGARHFYGLPHPLRTH